MDKDHQIELAEAQMIGFYHARSGYSLKSLVESMGLTKEEWEKMQAQKNLWFLTDDDQKEISKIVSKN